MLPKFDELDNLQTNIERLVVGKYKVKMPELIDTVLDFLITAMLFGMEYTNKSLHTTKKLSTEAVEKIINKSTAGETWQSRIEKYYATNDFGMFGTLLDTESKRVFNESAFETAKLNGATFKTWQTMEDLKVRDTHTFLQGVSLPIDEEFFTIDGDSALQPFGFGKATNNCNCRCYLEFKKEG